MVPCHPAWEGDALAPWSGSPAQSPATKNTMPGEKQQCACSRSAFAVSRYNSTNNHPQPKGSEVLLKVLAAGVCHSDLHLAEGWFDLGGGKKLSLADRGMKLPVTLGHENVGEVVAVGPDAAGRQGRRPSACASVDRLRHLRAVSTRRRKSLPRHAQSRRLSRTAAMPTT